MPACSEIAASALTSARTEPTERSMPPVVMTKVIAAATIISGAIWRMMLRRLVGQKGVGDERKQKTATTTKKTAMRATPPLAWTTQPGAIAQRVAASDAAAVTSRALPRSGRARGRDGLELPPDDEVDDLLDIGLADQPLGDVAALIHDHDPVADEEEVLQPVGDQDDADALARSPVG